jgi:SNF2 family DNA or RNA helicase
MINPLVVQKFLNRQLRDSSLAKELSAGQIDARLAGLQVVPAWHTPPLYLLQKVCFLLAQRRKRYLLFLDLGLGKTWISLAVFQHAMQMHRAGLGDKPRALVLVPGTANVGQWVLEVEKHCPTMRAQGVTAVGAANRMIQVNGMADIVVVTYAGFLGLICSGKRTGGGEQETKGWQIDKKKLRVFQEQFNFFVADESTAARNAKSLTYRACKALSWKCQWAYALTGTPWGKDPVALWSQFCMIDRGETLGETLGLFREAFFNKKQDFWAGWKYEFDKRKKRLLNRVIRHNSIRYADTDCADLPKLRRLIRPVEFVKENQLYYERLLSQLRAAKGDFSETQNTFMRLRQIAGGYISTKDGNGDQLDIRFKVNPKMDELLQVLSEIPEGRKAVVFHEYKLSGELICAALKKAKISHDRLYSGTKKAIKQNIVERFQNKRVLVASSAGAYGLNLQIANYCIWFERCCDPIIHRQEMKRCHRIGQERTVYLIDLAVRGSVDERIISAHKNGEDLFRAVIDGKFGGLFDSR